MRYLLRFILGALVGAILVMLWDCPAHSRDRNVPAAFRKIYPCPATGLTTGPCPGWNIDHVTPICRGGADAVSNLQWLRIDQHKLKTRGDCRTLPGQ